MKDVDTEVCGVSASEDSLANSPDKWPEYFPYHFDEPCCVDKIHGLQVLFVPEK